ncbi:MAG: anaerobic glycerol-3-phosphate dehydrogenase subunit C [Anaerohalosphaeraceae bacterium]|nr:anaerobic glycerol-3-phosphate dehydrogenase subunit C [Anaerohalosphaeraceae bacterium]
MSKALKKTNSEKVAAEISKLISGHCSASIFNRVACSTDASIYQIIPLCVVSPKTAADVSEAVRYACENKIPITARGGGSGLAGESLTVGIMLDMTSYMNKIIGIDEKNSTVTCQGGVVLDDLNNYLAPFGRKIGPDPSSGNRAVIGGVVANNATGAHSLQFGHIAEYVEKIQAVLAGGELVEITNGIVPEKIESPKLRGIAANCLKLLAENSEIIEKAMPPTKRNRSGYNVAGVASDGKIDLAKLLAGSEGTLAVFTEITLRSVEVPKFKGVVQLEFDSMGKMAKVVPIIADSGAAACELMDGNLIKTAREAFAEYRDLLNPVSAASLLVEHIGDGRQEVIEKIDNTIAQAGTFAYDSMKVLDKQSQERLWKCRKDAVPLLSRRKGYAQPVPFVEDVSVDNSKLGEYIAGLVEIGEKYDVELVYYGHAGDGELHIRPWLDLGCEKDLEKMGKIADDVFNLAWSLGGSISGEHADGLVRAAFIKKQYGEEFYEILQMVKQIFDPQNMLNPGKIINDDPKIMTTNLRAEKKILDDKVKTTLLFDKDEFAFELIQCTGCGLCRSTQSPLRMCPVFRATGDEIYSSRAKINLISAWAKGLISEQEFESVEFDKILSSCVNCKMCAVECPAGVDVSKVIIEARARRAAKNGLSITAKTLSHNRLMSILAGAFAPISNFVISLGALKWVMEKVLGIDSRRAMPRFERASFVKKARKFLASAGAIENPVDKVVYFTDAYANYNDHELGFAVIKFLRYNNIDVIVPDQRSAPLPGVVYGDVRTSKKDLAYNVEHLWPGVEAGRKIICSEPSAALCLKEDMRFFIDSERAKAVSENTFELFNYLLALHKDGKLKTGGDVKKADAMAYHCPCHLKSLGSGAAVELLRELIGADITDLDAGCCGIAGTFGMQKKNYALSEKIGATLAEAVRESSAETIITECSTCKMQIEHLTGKKAVHPIKVLAEAFGLN